MSKSFSTIFVIISAILLAYLALINYGSALHYLIPPRLTIINDSLEGQFFAAVLFAVSVGLIPVGCMITWNRIKAETLLPRIISIIIILGCVALATALRYKMIASWTANTPDNIQNTSTLQALRYPYYIFAGLLTGVAMSIVFLRKRKRVSEHTSGA